MFINDLDPGIAAFWRVLFTQTDALVEAIWEANVDLGTWHGAKEIYDAPETADDLALGLSTFFLNRTNHSGILTARPIGGLEQTGRWKIDARFNKEDLIKRIQVLGAYRNRVEVSELDARVFIGQVEESDPEAFLYVDPPYIGKGKDLYLNSLAQEDHLELATQLVQSSLRWVLSYDVNDSVAEDLYAGLDVAQFGISHFANKQHIGQELFVFGPNLATPNLDGLSKHNASWLPKAQTPALSAS